VLYDRKTDPHEQRNLWESHEHRTIREQLHAKTREWMKKVGDEGWSYQKIIEVSFTARDRELQRAGKAAKRSGVLIGSPRELLRTKDADIKK